MPPVFQNVKLICDYHGFLMAKSWMVLLGYLHCFAIFSFQGHFKMLAAYHSTYLWPDLKTLQDLRAAVGEGDEGQDGGRNGHVPGGGSGVQVMLILWFSFLFLFFLGGGQGGGVKSAAYLIP